MIDLIFIGIIAVFIAGMLWSDRDSRRVRWYERVNVSIAKFTQCGASAQDLVSAFQALGRASRGIIEERQPLEPSHPIFHGKSAALKKASREALNQGYIITHRKSLTESEKS